MLKKSTTLPLPTVFWNPSSSAALHTEQAGLTARGQCGEGRTVVKPFDAYTVDLWQGQLSDDESVSQRYWPLLDPAECARAGTLSNPLMKLRHIEVRGRLRTLLANYLGQDPSSIRIARTGQGKPYLPDNPQYVFNLSHTRNQLVIAIAQHGKLGVDIELYQHRANLAALVMKCFADVEVAYWHSLPETQKIKAFYQFWTKKEAFVKATGRGIALGLKRCVINPQQPCNFLSLPEGYGLVGDWRMISLDLATLIPDELLCVAVVVDEGLARLRCFQMG